MVTDSHDATRQRPPGTFRVGSLFGSDVLITTSWFFGAGLITLTLAPWVERQQPDLGGLAYLAAAAFAIVLYLSVLLHEAAHALAARRYGFPVTSVTLHFLGGHTSIEGHARTPWQEFVIAVVGPLTSIAIGVAALGAGFLVPEGLTRMAIDLLAAANLIVGVLNLVPGLPLDGGRVLKSGVWRLTGSPSRGTVAAGWGGRIAALCAVAWPFLMQRLVGWTPTTTDFLFGVVIGVFLWTGATQAIHSAKLRERLPRIQARALARRTLAVPEDLPVAEAVRRAREAEAGSIVTVSSTGVPIGLVSEHALMATPEDRRPWVAVSSLTRAIDAGLVLPVDLAGEELILRMQDRPSTEYLLVDEQGGIAGVLSTVDVDRAFRETR